MIKYLFIILAAVLPQKQISLNGTWNISMSKSEPAVWESTVPVPGLITMATPSLGENLDAIDSDVNYDCVWYNRTFSLDSQAYDRALLSLRARYNAEVWLNGKMIGSDQHSTYSHGKFDLSKAIKYGEVNTLSIKVGSWNTATFPSKENSAEWWRSTRAPGIWDDVVLTLEGNVSADRALIQPDVQKGIVSSAVCVSNDGSETVEASVKVEIIDNEDILSSSEIEVSLPQKSESIFNLDTPSKMLTCWTPGKEGNPKMYVLRTTVTDEDGTILSQRTDKFGYRSIKVQGKDVLLNGSKIIFRSDNIAYVRALNRWSAGLFDEVWLRHFIRTLVQEYNLNYVRIHLGHAYDKLYDIADEEGLMIEDEWRFMHDSEPEGKDLTDTEAELRRWVTENYNHPSIVAWDQENEGDVRLSSVIEQLRVLDPTRLWSEYDFIQKHVYEYSEREVKGFDGYSIPQDKPYTVLESCRFWTNEFGQLELREDFKTSRTASGWHLFYYTIDDVQQLLADLHSDIGTYYRCSRIQAWSPFAALSGRTNGHSYFLGNIIDSLTPQPNLLQLKRLNEPIGASIRMNQAVEWYEAKTIYKPHSRAEKSISVWNDFGTEVKVTLIIRMKTADGKLRRSIRKKVTVEPYGCTDVTIKLPMPHKQGVCYAQTTLKLSDGSIVEGVERRFMVARDTSSVMGIQAFGGRYKRPEKGFSIIENFTRTSVPEEVQDKILSVIDGSLIDKLTVGDDGYFKLQTTRYESRDHFYTDKLIFDSDGDLVSSRETEGIPYINLPEPVRKAIVEGIGAVPQNEARVTIQTGGEYPVYEITVVGFDNRFRFEISDEGKLISKQLI